MLLWHEHKAKVVVVSKYKVIDLFSGAGGFTQGFVDAGFEPVLAVEREKDIAATYAANFGSHVVARDIESLSETIDAGKFNLRADVVVGGPPCQGFSNLTGNRAGDPRRSLWRYFMNVVEASDCRVFVVENVPNMITSNEAQMLIKRAGKLGFRIDSGSVGVLLASDFGVPQNRRRGFIIGSRLGACGLPEPTTRNKKVSVWDAFEGIDPKVSYIDPPVVRPLLTKQLHIGRKPQPKSVLRYKAIGPGGNRTQIPPDLMPDCWKNKQGGTDLFGRLEWDGPARCTIRTEFFKPEKGRYLHPVANRPITHWEAARLQTFPDDFKWHGTKIRIALQIGNAVPPLLARAIADHVKKHLRVNKVRPTRRPKASDVQQLCLPLGQRESGASRAA